MGRKDEFDHVIKQLDSAGASMRCQDLASLLMALGFEVRDGKKVGHKVFVHHGIPAFTSGGYTCGHGRNPEIKRAYINKVKRLLKQHESDLIQF